MLVKTESMVLKARFWLSGLEQRAGHGLWDTRLGSGLASCQRSGRGASYWSTRGSQPPLCGSHNGMHSNTAGRNDKMTTMGSGAPAALGDC